ncbi:MAG: uroporphyrinogen-III synthase [Luteimonas sp.]
MPVAALAGCYVISLRPVGAHAAIRRAAAAQGARVLALSPWTLVDRDDAGTRSALRAALACERVLFTSPAAVRAANTLQPLRARRGQRWFAVGAGTAAALRRAGIADVGAPQRMDSDGLLALPALRDVRGASIGLVTAPGGRDRIAPALRRRGARVSRADVYARVAVPPSTRAVAALRALDAPAWLALSSGEALERTLATLPVEALAILRRARVVAASARLAQLAQAQGFADITVAASAQPRDLLAAAAQATALPLA